MSNKDRVFIKFGTESLTDKSGLLNQRRIERYARKIMQLRQVYGVDVDIVSSGAVAAGKKYYKDVLGRNPDEASPQSLAATGNPLMAMAWNSAFINYERACGLILVTNSELEDENRWAAIQETDRLFKADNMFSLYNADDAKEHDELDKLVYGGDNDGLVAHTAIKFGAVAVLFATNVDGFMTSDKVVMPEVIGTQIPELEEHIFVEPGKMSRGGIKSKLENAHLVAQSGAAAFIINAEADYCQAMAGQIGTRVIQ